MQHVKNSLKFQDEEPDDEPENVEEISFDSVALRESSLIELQFRKGPVIFSYIANVNPKKKLQLLGALKKNKREPPVRVVKFILKHAFAFTVTDEDGKTKRFMNRKHFDQVFSPFLIDGDDLGFEPFRAASMRQAFIYA